jgi:hypothetical protein
MSPFSSEHGDDGLDRDYAKCCDRKGDSSPREDGGDEPRQEAYHGRPGLRADVAGLQRFADRVVPLEADRQNGQNGSVGDGQLDEGNGET